MTTTFTESDVLFELFLPLLCEQHATQLAHFSGNVVFCVSASTKRYWNLQGKKKPFIQRGNIESADATITVDEELIKEVVQGREPNLQSALQNGRISFQGNLDIIRNLEFALQDAKNALQTMLMTK